MGDLRLGGHDYHLVQVNGSITNSWREEDASPTAVQSAENAPDASSVPVATTEYTNWQGSLGLWEREQQPADYSRFYVADWDATRPMQVSAWIRWPGDTVAITGAPAAVYTPSLLAASLYPAFTLTDDPSGPGFIAALTTGAGAYFRWNGTSFAYQGVAALPVSPVAPGYVSRFAGTLIPTPPTITASADNKLLYGGDSGGGAGVIYDALTNTSLATAGWLCVNFYDYTMVFALANGNLTVSAWNMTGPTQVTTQKINQVPTQYTSGAISAPTIGSIKGEHAIAGAIASQGVIWLATDRKVYSIQWNDNYNTFQISELFSVPRVTGPPVDWNGEIYVPCGNRLAHIVPGQKGFSWSRIDQFDTMPPPFNGRVVQCHTTPDALYAKVVEESATSCRAALMRLDESGAWSCVYVDDSTSLLGRMPMVATIDATNPPALGMFTDGTHVRLFPAQDAGRNPRTLAITQRPQVATVRGISAWETGVARSNQKQLLRYRIEVEDLVGLNASVFYQFPTDAYPGAADTFPTGVGAGTGTWHPCGVITAGTQGYSGAIDANGNGWVWIEFDAATHYGDGVGLLPLYPSYTAVRWLIQIQGDPTGTHAPLLRKFRFDREEYISKAKVITAYLDLSTDIRRRGALDDGTGATDTVRNAAWVQAELAYIESMVTSKHAQTLVTPKGATYQVEVTKWNEALDSTNDEGVVGAKVQLSLKVIPLLGLL